jgi:hypothetical protein
MGWEKVGKKFFLEQSIAKNSLAMPEIGKASTTVFVYKSSPRALSKQFLVELCLFIHL